MRRVAEHVVSVAAPAGAGTVTTTIPHTLTAGSLVMLIGTGWRWLDGAHSVYSIPGSSHFTVSGMYAAGPSNAGIVSIGQGPFLTVTSEPLIVQMPPDQQPAQQPAQQPMQETA